MTTRTFGWGQITREGAECNWCHRKLSLGAPVYIYTQTSTTYRQRCYYGASYRVRACVACLDKYAQHHGARFERVPTPENP